MIICPTCDGKGYGDFATGESVECYTCGGLGKVEPVITDIQVPFGYEYFSLTPDECKALVKEFGTSYINANENYLAALVMQRMIGFVNELAKDNS